MLYLLRDDDSLVTFTEQRSADGVKIEQTLYHIISTLLVLFAKVLKNRLNCCTFVVIETYMYMYMHITVLMAS